MLLRFRNSSSKNRMDIYIKLVLKSIVYMNGLLQKLFFLIKSIDKFS